MISRETHTKEIEAPKKLKLRHTKIKAHTLKKSTSQKSNFTIYTQRGNPNQQTQSDGKTLNPNNIGNWVSPHEFLPLQTSE
jgi:hypothetical protein